MLLISLCVPFEGLGMSKLQFFLQKNIKFLSMLGHQNRGFGTGSGFGCIRIGSAIRKNAGSLSALNPYGSTTLVLGPGFFGPWMAFVNGVVCHTQRMVLPSKK
jgi:hypothetical protein